VLLRRTTDYASVADEMLREILAEAEAVARERVAAAAREGRTLDARALLAAGNQYEERNVRRRVYDALNVLMAAGIISKDRMARTISWKGLPARPKDELDHLEVRGRAREREGARARCARCPGPRPPVAPLSRRSASFARVTRAWWPSATPCATSSCSRWRSGGCASATSWRARR
jgi:hypothetical protein